MPPSPTNAEPPGTTNPARAAQARTAAAAQVIDTVVIGAGHAGLAMSRCLTDRGVEHVVLERGRAAERWRSARSDAFRLLTPNWMSRLPGWSYTGPDPGGYMTAPQLTAYLEGYAADFGAPVHEHTTVTSVTVDRSGFRTVTDRGVWRSRNVVVATGYHTDAVVPGSAAALDPEVTQVTAADYRRPELLPDGPVLVVGASSSGVQIADELARAGRRVTLAAGSHTRLPRRYRGRDVLWWLDRLGKLDRTLDELTDPGRATREPSLQLCGDRRRLDLGTLAGQGVTVAGRLRAIRPGRALFAGDLGASTHDADRRLRRLLADIDGYAAAHPDAATEPPEPVAPLVLPTGPPTVATAGWGAVRSVVWATGFRPAYPWLAVPVLDAAGRIRHRRGMTTVPGMFAIGLRFQHRRNATFIDGARHDAGFLADRILARRPAVRVT